MNLKRTLGLLAVVIMLGAIPAVATAQTRKTVTTKRTTSQTVTPAKVAKELPEGFGIKTVIGFHQ